MKFMIVLPKELYPLVARILQEMPLNHLFARMVTEGKVDGVIYADDERHPQTCYIRHPYGMSLLLGDAGNDAFNQDFQAYALNDHRHRTGVEWMQTWPRAWDDRLQNLLGDRMVPHADNADNQKGMIEVNGRANFRFDPACYAAYRRLAPIPPGRIVPTDTARFEAMEGSVVPRYFWQDAGQFVREGRGFSLLVDGELAATAFAAYCLGDHQLELGIETREGFRGRGAAEAVCSALIDDCLARGLEPVWSCRFENTPSYRLAQKLGFEPTTVTPYYRLPL